MTQTASAPVKSVLSPSEEGCLRAIVGHIIPPSVADGMPGADDPAIFADIVRAARREPDALRQAIAIAEAMAGGHFVQLSRPEQAAILTQFRKAHPALARACEVVTARCYYRDDRVMRSIGMEVRPPFPLGFAVDDGDWDLLDPVRRRGRVYRETK